MATAAISTTWERACHPPPQAVNAPSYQVTGSSQIAFQVLMPTSPSTANPFSVDTDRPATVLQVLLKFADAGTVAGPVAGMVLPVRRLDAVPVPTRQREHWSLLRLPRRLSLVVLR